MEMPDFLTEDVEKIHRRMMEKAPPGVSAIEGEIFWDATRPSAFEKERTEKIQMQNILKMAHSQTATGKYLEFLGECQGIFKNNPTVSTGYVEITANKGTIIPLNYLVGTKSTDIEESISFETLESKTIDENGKALIKCKCTKTGIIGNVEANTITLVYKPINGLQSITNPKKFTGGTEIEDEKHYRQRIIEAEQEDKLSGADTDYIRWAKEVDGVGYADCIELWNGPQTVKVLILDSNNEPANDELITKVKDYIYPDKKSGESRGGKAPAGALVTIATATTLKINVSAKFIFTDGFNQETILTALKTKISEYLKKIKINGVVKYKAIDTIIGSYVLQDEGIDDYANLTINKSTTNIQLVDQIAAIGDVINASN
ncbi:baseplate J/gp47 family protein [Clostridium botulinum]|nr:baseplate J/gp47 family protein [Clostridium botulinum]